MHGLTIAIGDVELVQRIDSDRLGLLLLREDFTCVVDCCELAFICRVGSQCSLSREKGCQRIRHVFVGLILLFLGR